MAFMLCNGILDDFQISVLCIGIQSDSTEYNTLFTEKTSNTRKKVTASARARISNRKVRRQDSKKLNESYIQSKNTDMSKNSQSDHHEPFSTKDDSSRAILSMLGKLLGSNQAIIQKIEATEQK